MMMMMMISWLAVVTVCRNRDIAHLPKGFDGSKQQSYKQSVRTIFACFFLLSVFTHDSCTGRYCWERVLATGIPSVRLSVYRSRSGMARWDRDSGSSPYDSLESLVSYEVICCQRVRRFPSNEGIKEWYSLPLEIVILPLLAHLAWKRLQIDTDLLLIITSTADELSSSTNIDDLERPRTPK